jgi:general secretion pathway protein M
VNSFWQNLNERERWMVIIAVTTLVSYLFYVLLYSPIVDRLDTNTEQLLQQKATLQWMQQVKPESIANNNQKKVSNSQLLTLIATELKNNHTLKFPYQLQQTGSGEIQLSFEKVPFQYFISWLSQLKKNYRITVKQFNVEKTETAGITKLLIIISADG